MTDSNHGHGNMNGLRRRRLSASEVYSDCATSLTDSTTGILLGTRDESYVDPLAPMNANDNMGGSDKATTGGTTTNKSINDRSRQLSIQYFLWMCQRPNRVKGWLMRMLQLYVRLLNKPIHRDRMLKLLQWSLWLASSMVQLPSASSNTTTILPSISKGLAKLSIDISNARYVTRLLEWPTAVEGVLTDSWCSTSARYPTLFRILGRLLAWSMVGYYPTEHLAYIQWITGWKVFSSSTPIESVKRSTLSILKRPLRWSPELWSAISCQFWFLYLVVEAAQCAFQWSEMTIPLTGSQSQSYSIDEQDDDNGNGNGNNNTNADANHTACQQKQKQHQLRNIQLQLLRDILFALPCLHYALPNWDTKPLLPIKIVNSLFWLESIASMFQSLHAEKS